MSAGCLDEVRDSARAEPPVIPGTIAPPCPLVADHFRVEAIALARSGREARALGFDLDGDGYIDNAAGSNLTLMTVYETETGTAFADLEAGLDAKLADGRLHWVIGLETCADGSSDYSRVSSHQALDADSDGVLELVREPGAIAAVGAGARAELGFGPVPASALVDFLDADETVEWVSGDGFTVAYTVRGDELAARFGAGLDAAVSGIIRRQLALFFTRQLELDNSELARELDVNRDGRISEEEVEDDWLLGTVIDGLDLDLFSDDEDPAVYWPDRDGIKDRMSFAVSLVGARVEVE